MSLALRIILIVASVLNCVWVAHCIRKSRVKIENTIFWILFSLVLIIISIFPQIVFFGARITGVQSATNFIFLTIIFILIVKVFRLSISLSQTESKLQSLVQRYALDHMEKKESETDPDYISTDKKADE